MEENNDLVKLAGVVEDMISRFNQLKKEKEILLGKMQDRELEIVELKSTIDSLKEEKTDAYQRVSGILGSIDEWEKNLLEEEKESSEDIDEKTLQERSSQLFAMEG